MIIGREHLRRITCEYECDTRKNGGGTFMVYGLSKLLLSWSTAELQQRELAELNLLVSWSRCNLRWEVSMSETEAKRSKLVEEARRQAKNLEERANKMVKG